MVTNILIKTLTLSLSSILLFSCGGSGSDSSSWTGDYNEYGSPNVEGAYKADINNGVLQCSDGSTQSMLSKSGYAIATQNNNQLVVKLFSIIPNSITVLSSDPLTGNLENSGNFQLSQNETIYQIGTATTNYKGSFSVSGFSGEYSLTIPLSSGINCTASGDFSGEKLTGNSGEWLKLNQTNPIVTNYVNGYYLAKVQSYQSEGSYRAALDYSLNINENTLTHFFRSLTNVNPYSLLTTYSYAENGQVTEYKNEYSDFHTDSSGNYTFDSDNLLTEYNYYFDTQFVGKKIWTYGTNKFIERLDWYYGTDLFQIYDYSWSDGRLNTRTRTSVFNTYQVNETNFYYYPDTWFPYKEVVEINITSSNPIERSKEYFSDNYGNTIAISYNEFGEISSVQEFHFEKTEGEPVENLFLKDWYELSIYNY